MNRSELRLRYEPDDEWCGKLIADVKSQAFSGSGSAWFDRTNIKKTFSTALREFPLNSSLPPTLEGGFWSPEKEGALDQCHLRITVSPHDNSGRLLVCVELATPVSTTTSLDMQHTVTARYITSYEAVSRFTGELDAVLDGKSEEAVLASEDI